MPCFSHRDKTTGSRKKLQEGKFWWDIRKRLFTMRAVKHLNRGQRVCGITILRNIQNTIGQGPKQSDQRWLDCPQGFVSSPVLLTDTWVWEVPSNLNYSMILLCMKNAVFFRLDLLPNSNSVSKNIKFQLNVNSPNKDQFLGPINVKSPKQLMRRWGL